MMCLSSTSIHVPGVFCLDQALKEQARRHGVEFLGSRNLAYAYGAIQPGTCVENAIVVWAANGGGRITQVDEYCRRKRGDSPRMFDHPLFELTDWCLPDTQRLILFQEQFYCLIQELTGVSRIHGAEIVQEIYGSPRLASPNDDSRLNCFAALVRRKLTKPEIMRFYRFVQKNFALSLPYYWCSTIVERATQMALRGTDEH